MEKLILFLILCFAASKNTNYFEIKRNESLNFGLDNPDSSFYAYLPYKEDYEIEEDNYINHFLRIDKKIGFKHRIINDTGDLPDESSFNKSSKGIDSKNNYEYQSLEPFEGPFKNIKLKEYYKLEKDKDRNKISIFVFYLEDEFKDTFDSNEYFTVSRVDYNMYNNNTIIDDELGNNDLKLFAFETNYHISNNSLLFINYPISTIYEYNSSKYEKINSNINLFQYKNEGNVSTILLFVYNPNNEKHNLSIEYRIKDEKQFYRALDLKEFNNNTNYTSYGDYRNLFYVSIEPGLYDIIGEYASEKYIYLFKDDINKIKNLTDLKNLKHYKYTREGYRYISENNFIIMICSTKRIRLQITKIEVKEEIKNLNIYNFTYFKITKGGRTIEYESFNIKAIIIKLLSNNGGKVSINSVDQTFEKNEVKRIDINDDQLRIHSNDTDFIFAIKLEIPDDKIKSIENKETTLYYMSEKFLRFKIEIHENYFMHFNFDTFSSFCVEYNYEFNEGASRYEMTKGDITFFSHYPYLDLGLYTNQNSIYLTLYVNRYDKSGICNNIVFNFDYIPKFHPQKNNFSLTETSENYYPYKESEKNVFFFIPCKSMYVEYRFTNEIGSKSPDFSFKISKRGDLADYLTFSPTDYGYYIYYQLKDNEEDYSFIENKYSEYNLKILNETHIRLYINETFSDAPQINYTLAIYQKKTSIDIYTCNYFENYFLNQSFDALNNSENYYFTKNDLENNSNETEYIYFLDLPIPKKYNLRKSNQLIYYKLMGITGPKYKYVKIYYTKYLRNCYETCSTCSDIGIENDQNCISCKDGKVLLSKYESYYKYRNTCLDICPKGYYEEDKKCKECYNTCERCSGSGNSLDNKCLSCNLTSEYKYLVNVPGKGRNCVQNCSDDTVLNKMECIKKEEEGMTTSNIMITVGVVGGFILIIIVVIVFFILDKILLNEEYTVLKEMNTKTPLNVKEAEMGTKTPSYSKEAETKTPSDQEETPGIN